MDKITAQELRNGIYLIANGVYEGKVMQLDHFTREADGRFIVWFKDNNTGEYLEDCNPIGLDASILEKCGFEKCSLGWNGDNNFNLYQHPVHTFIPSGWENDMYYCAYSKNTHWMYLDKDKKPLNLWVWQTRYINW